MRFDDNLWDIEFASIIAGSRAPRAARRASEDASEMPPGHSQNHLGGNAGRLVTSVGLWEGFGGSFLFIDGVGMNDGGV